MDLQGDRGLHRFDGVEVLDLFLGERVGGSFDGGERVVSLLDEERLFEVVDIEILEESPLVGAGGIDPIGMMVDDRLDDDVVEGERGRQLLAGLLQVVRVDEGGIGLDPQRAEQGDAEEGLVLAVPEAVSVDLRGRIGLVGAGPHFDAEIADVVLDEADDGQRPVLVARVVLGDPGDLVLQLLGKRSGERVNREGPIDDFLPRLKLGELHPAVGIVPGRGVVLLGKGGDVLVLPGQEFAVVGGLGPGRFQGIAVILEGDRPSGGEDQLVAEEVDRARPGGRKGIDEFPVEDRIGAGDGVGVVDLVPDADVLQVADHREPPVEHLRVEVFLPVQDLELLGVEAVLPDAVPLDLQPIHGETLAARIVIDVDFRSVFQAVLVDHLLGVMEKVGPGLGHLLAIDQDIIEAPLDLGRFRERDGVGIERLDPGGGGNVEREAGARQVVGAPGDRE